MIIQNGVGITTLLNGSIVKQALDAANETVAKGIYDSTTLSAVDADLATGNIKNGITMFGFAGSADVRDISDATAIAAEVIAGETFYAVSGGRKTGTMPIQSLSPVDEVVAAGYYGATTLSTIDVDLASANILSGITIFGFAGVATVQDIADADAVLADVMNGKTFYSVTGGRKTGNLATVAITNVNDDYPAGYHVGNIGGLDAIDTDLATANIKSGITIFGKPGSADVRDVSDANAVVGGVKAGQTFYSVTGARKTGTLATRTLNPANETVQDGYYAATTLSAVDVQLATTNILSGVNIFGFVGVATVQEIGAADAVLADVKNGKTFFSVTGGIKTGNLATVSLSAAANAYPAGYHAGAASLTAVDADLATGNIKSGITIFGVAGSANVRDISDANALVGEVKTGQTFYAVSGARKTGTGTKTLSSANETVAAGYYVATTLSAVDADLAVANILTGVTIFGFVGTVIDIDYALVQGWLPASGATVADFQANPGTGTFTDPAKINNNNTGDQCLGDVGEYVEVDFGKHVFIQRYRYFGASGASADGEFKIQYWDLALSAWVDWETGISTRGASWTGLVTVSKKLTTKIRVIGVIEDSGWADVPIGEMEIIY